MIQEIADIEVQPGLEAMFEQGVAAAAALFQRARGCRGLKLERSIERPTHYLLVVQWDSVDDHMVGFRNSADFQEWRRLVGHCFARPPQVEHVQTVLSPF